jgi:hypothetical protein
MLVAFDVEASIMIRMRTRVFVAAAAAGVLLAAAQARAVPVFVHYDVAATGQRARAGFEFLDGATLQISLFETTPADASGLTGGSSWFRSRRRYGRFELLGLYANDTAGCAASEQRRAGDGRRCAVADCDRAGPDRCRA